MRILLLDIANLAYRYFYAVPPFTRADGTPVGAVFGLARQIMDSIEKDGIDVIIACDEGDGPTDRSIEFADYKAHRQSTPDDLARQWPLIDELFDAYSIPRISVPGVEADDIIASLAVKYGDSHEILIASADKDLMQLVTEKVLIYDMWKRQRLWRSDVVTKWWVGPELISDLLGLMGDASDNIPGIDGIGPKTAATLLTKYGSLEWVLSATDLTGKTAERVREHAEMARLSKKLATVRTDGPLPSDWEMLRIITPTVFERDELRTFFESCGFKSLLPRLRSSLVYRDESPDALPEAIPSQWELIAIVSDVEMSALMEKVRVSERVNIATEGEKFSLSRVCIWLEKDSTVYDLSLALPTTPALLAFLTWEFSGRLVSLDAKADLMRIESFLFPEKSPSSTREEGQGRLFG